MYRTLAGVALIAVLIAVVSVSPVSAQEGGISVSVVVDGDEVTDGERTVLDEGDDELFANVTVESENELNTLEARLDNRSVILGINGTSHDESYVLEPNPGPNFFTVTATDVNGNTATFTANLYSEPVTAVEQRLAVERTERRINATVQETAVLEERRQELEQTRMDLESRLGELENGTAQDGDGGTDDGDDEDTDGGDDGEGLPGFTVVTALLAAVLFFTYRRA
ncbi:MAG: hypothetical protein U5J64_08095 [Halobacteriales archaeon]|nr:hypothetical protein [Halobacteriales archaeon]